MKLPEDFTILYWSLACKILFTLTGGFIIWYRPQWTTVIRKLKDVILDVPDQILSWEEARSLRFSLAWPKHLLREHRFGSRALTSQRMNSIEEVHGICNNKLLQVKVLISFNQDRLEIGIGSQFQVDPFVGKEQRIDLIAFQIWEYDEKYVLV